MGRYAQIVATGRYLPEIEVPNDELRRRTTAEYSNRIAVSGDYRKVFPGVHLKYEPVRNMVARASDDGVDLGPLALDLSLRPRRHRPGSAARDRAPRSACPGPSARHAAASRRGPARRARTC